MSAGKSDLPKQSVDENQMIYQKPMLRFLVATNIPICTSNPELIRQSGGVIPRSGNTGHCNCICLCQSQCECLCINTCQCTCLSLCSCQSPCNCECMCMTTCPCECQCLYLKMQDLSYLGLTPAESNSLGTINQTYLVNEYFNYRRAEFGALIFDERTWSILKANETGAQILTLLNGKRTVMQIVQELARIYIRDSA